MGAQIVCDDRGSSVPLARWYRTFYRLTLEEGEERRDKGQRKKKEEKRENRREGEKGGELKCSKLIKNNKDYLGRDSITLSQQDLR